MKTCQEFILEVGIETIGWSLREDNFKYSSTSILRGQDRSIFIYLSYLCIDPFIRLYI